MAGNSQSGRRKQKAAATKEAAAPQGAVGSKRTPTSAFDPAAGAQVYEPEMICAQRVAKGTTQYQVKWVGYSERSNTWEPIEHLAGCEDMIVEFKKREKIRLQKLDEEAAAKRAQKEVAKAAELKAAAEAEARRRQEFFTGDAPNVAAEGARGPLKGTRRTSPWWRFFSEEGAELHHAHCVLQAPGKNEVCNEKIKCKEGPTGLRNHIMYVHPDEYVRVQQELKSKEELAGAGSSSVLPGNKVNSQGQLPAVPAKTRDSLHKAHSRWIVKRKRSFALVEDVEYRELWALAMHGAYTPPDRTTLLSGVLKLSAEGQEAVRSTNQRLREKGMKPAIAGDIWSDRGVSLFGIVQYHIDDDWNMIELVTAATPFSGERHTGVIIDAKTQDACTLAGLSHDVFSAVFAAVSDNGSNMIKGWDGFGRQPCCVHTVQLSVKLFLAQPAIAPVRAKEKGIVSHFSFATGVDGLGALKECQKKCILPEHHPIKDNDTRWSGSHAQMEFFRLHQRAIQLYDVEHARKAGAVYKQHQMDLEDWLVNTQATAVLQPVADWTQHMQGTHYATLPLVLPTLYHLMEAMAPDAPLVLSFPNEREYELLPCSISDGSALCYVPELQIALGRQFGSGGQASLCHGNSPASVLQELLICGGPAFYRCF